MSEPSGAGKGERGDRRRRFREAWNGRVMVPVIWYWSDVQWNYRALRAEVKGVAGWARWWFTVGLLVLVGVSGPWFVAKVGDGVQAEAVAETAPASGASGSSGDSGSGGSYQCPPAPPSYAFASMNTGSDGVVSCSYSRPGSTTLAADEIVNFSCAATFGTFVFKNRDGTTCNYTRGTSTSLPVVSRTVFSCPPAPPGGYGSGVRNSDVCTYRRSGSTTLRANSRTVYSCPSAPPGGYGSGVRSGDVCTYRRSGSTTLRANSRTVYSCPSAPPGGYGSGVRDDRTCTYTRSGSTTLRANSRTVYSCPSAPPGGYGSGVRNGRTCTYTRSGSTTLPARVRSYSYCPSSPSTFRYLRRDRGTCFYTRSTSTTRTATYNIYTRRYHCPLPPSTFRYSRRSGSTCYYTRSGSTTRSAVVRFTYYCPPAPSGGYGTGSRSGTTCTYTRPKKTTRTAISRVVYSCPSAPYTFAYSRRGGSTCYYTRSTETTRTAISRTVYWCPSAPSTFAYSRRGGSTCYYTRGTETTRTANSRTVYWCPSAPSGGYGTGSRSGTTCTYTRRAETTKTANRVTTTTCPTSPATYSYTTKSSTTCFYSRSGKTTRPAQTTTTYSCPSTHTGDFRFTRRNGSTCHFTRTTTTILPATYFVPTTTSSTTTTTSTTIPSTTTSTTTTTTPVTTSSTTTTTSTTITTTIPTTTSTTSTTTTTTTLAKMYSVEANGHSPTTTIITNPVTNQQTIYGQSLLEWIMVAGATRYKIIYEKEPFTGRNESELSIPRQTNQRLMRGLELKALHKITIEAYNGNNLIGRSNPIYTYPTHNAQDDIPITTPYFKVADIPIYGYRASTTYDYQICYNYLLDTLTEGLRLKAIGEIKKGLTSWHFHTQYYLFGSSSANHSCSEDDIKFLSDEKANYVLFLTPGEMPRYCVSVGMPIGCVKNAPKNGDQFTNTNIALEDTYAENLECQQNDIQCKEEQEEDRIKGCTKLARIVMHETGHVYGLHHGTVDDISVMYMPKDNLCNPTPFDVVAVKANYQSR